MSAQKNWITTGEVAAKLEMSAHTFRQSLDRLQEQYDFPLPAPHRLKPMTWRRDKIEEWIANQCPNRSEIRRAG
jgi:predicted DNA-binding transcriptional regulator AlpA